MIDLSAFTRENVRRVLAEVVEEFGPETVYEPPSGVKGDCVYYCRGNDGLEPSCLWGHVLLRLGMTYVDLDPYRDRTIWRVLHTIGVEDDGLKNAAASSQSYQDTGHSWGQCLEVFDFRLASTPF